MAKQYYRSIFLSDTHLGSRDAQNEVLFDFLKRHKSQYLYLVGDLIDVWQLRRRWHWPQEYNNVIHRILKLAKKGSHVTYIPGNHDEFFRNFFGLKFGEVSICPRVTHRTADGRRMLIMHGDEFDVVVKCNKWLALLGSAAYDKLVTANGMLNAVRRRFNMPYWSLAAYCKSRVKNASRYITSFEEALVHEARKHHVDGVICGHIHCPTIKDLHGLRYCNTGDWVENCTALVEHEDGRLEIINWLDQYEPHRPLPADADADELEHEAEVADFAPPLRAAMTAESGMLVSAE